MIDRESSSKEWISEVTSKLKKYKNPHYTVTAAIITNQNQILCMQRSASKYDYVSYKYEFPGGKLEQGDLYSLIVGSSNQTQNALGYNKEWNLRVASTDKARH